MFDVPHYHDYRSPLLYLADQIVSLELIWPFPLLAVGVLAMRDPLVTGVAVALALLPWVARLLVFGSPTRRPFIGSPLTLFVVSASVGMWAAYDPSLSWPTLLTLLGSVSLFFAIINSTLSPWRVGGGGVVVAALVAFYFVGQYAHFDYLEEAGRLAYLGRITGSLMPDLAFFTPHPNAVAGFLEGASLLGLALAWRERGGSRLAWGLAAAIIAYGLLISQSRGAWVGLAMAMGIGALLRLPNRTERLIVGGLVMAGGLLGMVAVARFVPPTQQASALSSVLGAANSRFVLYRNSLYLLGDYPFTGIGMGDTFAMVYSRYQLLIPVPFLTYSHNLFLSVGLGQGVLGLMALIWLLVGFYRFVGRVEGAGLDGQSLLFFRAAWLGTTITFVHGLIDSPQFSVSRWTMPMLFALLGLVVAIGRPALLRAAREETGRRRWPWVLAAAVVAFTVASLVFQRPLAGAWYANLGAVHQTRADLSPDLDATTREAAAARAATYFERALGMNPSQPVANRRLGMMALDRRDFNTAATYLERAYQQEPGNQATLKALGYAYLWTGRLDSAEGLLRQLDVRNELVEELGNWAWWWDTQGRDDLSAAADEMVRRLLDEK